MLAARVVKRIVFGACWLVVLPMTAMAWIEKIVLKSEGVFLTFAHLLAVIPGPVGVRLRCAFYFGALDACSWEVHIGFGSLFTHRGASVDRHVSTGAYCVIGHANIEEGVRIASRVSIPSGRRQHFDESGQLSDITRFDRVTIGRGCWIGEGAIIMADIGAGSVLSAGAVVVKNMPASALIGGNPAQVIRPLPSAAKS